MERDTDIDRISGKDTMRGHATTGRRATRSDVTGRAAARPRVRRQPRTASATSSAPNPRWTQRGWLLAALAIGLATAFFRLSDRGLWGDEVWEVDEPLQAIPKSAWAQPGLMAIGEAWGVRFPQGAAPVRLYCHKTPRVPDHVVFHEVQPHDASWPDYVQLGPRDRAAVRLSLRAVAPRLLRFVFFDLAGRDLNVEIAGRVAKLRAGRRGGRWLPIETPLPSDISGTFLVQFSNPGLEVSAISEVQVTYAS